MAGCAPGRFAQAHGTMLLGITHTDGLGIAMDSEGYAPIAAYGVVAAARHDMIQALRNARADEADDYDDAAVRECADALLDALAQYDKDSGL